MVEVLNFEKIYLRNSDHKFHLTRNVPYKCIPALAVGPLLEMRCYQSNSAKSIIGTKNTNKQQGVQIIQEMEHYEFYFAHFYAACF